MGISRLILQLCLIFCVLLPLRSEGGRSEFFHPSVSADQSRVSVDLYYETLCPYCSNFIVNYLQKFFTNGLIDVVDLHLVPYGNAKIVNGTIECQHGPYECFLNTLEACAIDIWPDVHEHFSFIYCLEALVLQQQYTKWETCFTKSSADIQRIAECYNSGHGKKLLGHINQVPYTRAQYQNGTNYFNNFKEYLLELKYQAETSALKPPHRYVPWVIVNGTPLYEDYRDVIRYICKSYKGVLPEACKSLDSEPFVDSRSQYNQVTYVDDIMSTSTV